MKLPDIKLTGYNAEYVKELFNVLGEEGRHQYLFTQIPIDTIYPGLFIITYSLLLLFIFKKVFTPGSKIQYFILVPILAGFFDYLENIGIIIMINMYPEFSYFVAESTNIFTISKVLLTMIFWFIFVYSLIILVNKRFRKKI